MGGRNKIDVFISIPFSSEFTPVSDVIKAAAEAKGLRAYRVDEGYRAEPIAYAIKQGIRGSRLVIADLTGKNPNVLHEIGAAQALDKPLILISQDDPSSAPFDVKSVRILRYAENRLDHLSEMLDRALAETTSDSELLREMLVPSSLGDPTRGDRFIIAVSPLAYRRATGRTGGYKVLRRTYSDYVGVRGILQSFGVLFDFDALPDVIDPEDHDDEVIRHNMNLYCIASPKANRWTGKLLEEYRKHAYFPQFQFKADPDCENLRNIGVSLFGDGSPVIPSGWNWCDPADDRHRRDFGIILRASNPFNDAYMATIIAGRGALGTEAASMALTDVRAIGQMRQQLAGLCIDLEDHKQGFYALVSVEKNTQEPKQETNPESLVIHRVERFKAR